MVVLAEAVRRLSELAGRDCGCLLTLDDLHHADARTLTVVEYLIDNIDRQPTALIGTMCADSCGALRLARSAAQRGTALVLELDRLSRDDIGLLAAACLGVDPAAVPDTAVELLWAGSAGNPYLAEELVTSMVDDGPPAIGQAGRQAGDQLRSSLLVTFTRALTRRVDLLDPRAKEPLLAAAMLGPRFPLAVVRAATGVDDRDLLCDLAGELLGTDGQADGWCSFRHPLIPEALLADLAPARRAALAGAVADALPVVYPGLPGEWCQTTANLLVEAGRPAAAGRLFTEVGRRALAQGAAAVAVTFLNRALELLPGNADAPRADAAQALLDALVESGAAERALASRDIIDEIGGDIEPRRRAGLHSRLAWAALVAGEPGVAMAEIDAAQALLGPGATAADTAPVDLVAAYLALEVADRDRLAEAEALARRAAVAAESVPSPEVLCKALMLLGVLTRSRDPDKATALLERAHAVAVQHDLPIAVIHALVRRGNDDALHTGGLERLQQARELATRAGAVAAQHLAETSMALHSVLLGDFAVAGSLLDQVLAATTRSRQVQTTRQALLIRAVLAAHRGRRREMDRALADVRRLGGSGQPRYAAWIHGLARAFCALLEEDRERAGAELDQARRAEGSHPTAFPLGGWHGIGLLLAALAGAGWPDGVAPAWPATGTETGTATGTEIGPVTGAAAGRYRWDRLFALYARAVQEGRDRRAAEAAATVAEALRVGAPYPMASNLGLRLAAEAAIADGWGTPVEWLRGAEEHFTAADVPAVAGACRALLRSTGLRVAQRRNGSTGIPRSLRSAGVTVREFEVLCFLANRLRNREIADRLHVSPRTVEGHISSLIAKTGLRNRLALSKLATTVIASHFVD